MNVHKTVFVGELTVVFDLVVSVDPTKYIFLFKKEDNRIYIFSLGANFNHTILLRQLYYKYRVSPMPTDVVVGGWTRLIDQQVRFSGSSKKYSNRILGERVSNIIQSLLLTTSEGRSKRFLPKGERKINQLRKKYKILQRV